jgi:hypothetical protein
MRVGVVILLVLVVMPAAAEDRFVLDLRALVPPVGVLDLEDAESVPEALRVMERYDQEFRLALWEAPLGRVTYDIASLQATLGREGIVGGEHMLGMGTTMSVFGAPPAEGGMIFPSREHPWREFSTAEKVRTVAYGSLLAALLYQMAQWAD